MEPVDQEISGNYTDSLIEILALDGIITRLRRLEAPEDAISWHRFFGALNLALLVLLFVTGSVMAFYYSPVPGVAYDSVDYALYSLPFGDVIKGIHHYSWNILLVVMGLHLLRAFVVGAYKPPRQLVWISGVILLVVIPLFIITGDLLPWDQKGYWSTRVRLSIISSVPFVGDFMVRIVQGGLMTGIVAINRFYVMHTIFLPCLLVFLMTIHFHFIVHKGLTGPLFGGSNPVKKVSFLPHTVNRWLILFILVVIVLGIIARLWTAPLGDPADPTDSSYIPKPEWWVLFLNQLVAIFRGSLSSHWNGFCPRRTGRIDAGITIYRLFSRS